MKKYKLSGLSDGYGHFSVIGTDHCYDKAASTLTVDIGDGGRKVIANVITCDAIQVMKKNSMKLQQRLE